MDEVGKDRDKQASKSPPRCRNRRHRIFCFTDYQPSAAAAFCSGPPFRIGRLFWILLSLHIPMTISVYRQ
nr:hypothetical protein [Paraburkholderia kirstenboschensis]